MDTMSIFYDADEVAPPTYVDSLGHEKSAVMICITEEGHRGPGIYYPTYGGWIPASFSRVPLTNVKYWSDKADVYPPII